MAHDRSRRLPLILDSLESIGRSWWTLVGGVSLGVALFFLAVEFLPRTYRAEARVVADLASDPADAAAADEPGLRERRLQETREELRRTLLGREVILAALTRAGVTRDPLESDEERTVDQTRNRISVVEAETSGVSVIRFRGDTPEFAAAVVNALADLVVESRSGSQPSVDDALLVELEDSLDQLRGRIEPLRARMGRFREQHAYETEAHRDSNRQRLASRQRDLEANRSALTNAQGRLATLTTQGPRLENLAEECVTRATPGGKRLIERQRELNRLEQQRPGDRAAIERTQKELESLLLGYVPTREELRAHRQCEIEAAKLVDVVAPTPREIDAVKQEIARLETEQVEIRQALETYEERLEAIPQREAELGQLTAEYEMLMSDYRAREARLFEARRQQAAGAAAQAGLYEVVARSPEQGLPLRPGNAMMILLSFGIGVVLFVSPVTVRSFLFPAVTSEAGLKAISPVPVLISVPELPAHEVVEADRRRLLRNLAFSMMTVGVAAMVVILTYYRG